WLRWRAQTGDGTGRWIPWAAGCALVVFYTVQVEARIPVFRDDYTLLSDTVVKSPNSGSVHAMLAAAYFERRDYDPAVTHLMSAVEERPDNVIGWLDLGQFYANEQKYDEAIAALKKATKLAPRYEVAWVNLAKVYADKGDWTQAAACYTHLAELKPASAEFYSHLAAMADRNRQTEEAISQEAVNLERGPADPKKLLQVADSLARSGRWAQAAAALRQAAKEDPNNVAAWMKLGICLDQTQDSAGAIDAYEHALSLQPELVLARKNMAKALVAAGRTDEAIVQFKTILEKNPG